MTTWILHLTASRTAPLAREAGRGVPDGDSNPGTFPSAWSPNPRPGSWRLTRRACSRHSRSLDSRLRRRCEAAQVGGPAYVPDPALLVLRNLGAGGKPES